MQSVCCKCSACKCSAGSAACDVQSRRWGSKRSAGTAWPWRAVRPIVGRARAEAEDGGAEGDERALTKEEDEGDEGDERALTKAEDDGDEGDERSAPL